MSDNPAASHPAPAGQDRPDHDHFAQERSQPDRSERLSAERIRADVEQVLGEPAGALGEEENLLDRGMDSIRLMSLVESWRKAGVETDFITLAEEPSVAAWTRLLVNR